jgi:hypothetical protein
MIENKWRIIRMLIALIITVLLFHVTTVFIAFNATLVSIFIDDKSIFVTLVLYLWFFYMVLYSIMFYMIWWHFALPRKLQSFVKIREIVNKIQGYGR